LNFFRKKKISNGLTWREKTKRDMKKEGRRKKEERRRKMVGKKIVKKKKKILGKTTPDFEQFLTQQSPRSQMFIMK